MLYASSSLWISPNIFLQVHPSSTHISELNSFEADFVAVGLYDFHSFSGKQQRLQLRFSLWIRLGLGDSGALSLHKFSRQGVKSMPKRPRAEDAAESESESESVSVSEAQAEAEVEVSFWDWVLGFLFSVFSFELRLRQLLAAKWMTVATLKTAAVGFCYFL